MQTTIRRNSPLSNDDLAKYAPAVFASAPAEHLSSRYSQLRTIDVIEALRTAGWAPVSAAQGSGGKDLALRAVQKHVIRFRHPDMGSLSVGDTFPELVLTNSHNGTSAFQFLAGLYRLVCSNGLVRPIGNAGSAGSISVRHTGITTNDVIDAAFKVSQEAPQIGASVEAMRATTLDSIERQAFANMAANIRWGSEEKSPVAPAMLLSPRRWDDKANDLWTTFNIVQENMVRGGIRGRNALGRRATVRAIGSVDADLAVNKGLWGLAEEMMRLKRAASGAENGAASATVEGTVV